MKDFSIDTLQITKYFEGGRGISNYKVGSRVVVAFYNESYYKRATIFYIGKHPVINESIVCVIYDHDPEKFDARFNTDIFSGELIKERIVSFCNTDTQNTKSFENLNEAIDTLCL